VKRRSLFLKEGEGYLLRGHKTGIKLYLRLLHVAGRSKKGAIK